MGWRARGVTVLRRAAVLFTHADGGKALSATDVIPYNNTTQSLTHNCAHTHTHSITEVDGSGKALSATNVIPYKNTTALVKDLNPGSTYKVR